jgi:catechol 2,3-dioxygenase-like lactoylglutathione lyase family enzyme
MLRGARYGTRDLDRARTFYDAIAQILGARRVMDRDELTAYQGPNGGLFVIGKPLAGEASVGNGTQLVFEAPTRAAVDAAHARALELGGTCEGPPGFRGPAEMSFYAAYFRDLDGNKVVLSKMGAE